ncbi:uncharacterized protein BO80DRAFT_495782 [Aspergillus ibericus CBS 121593]|uniref:Uncharacterized protein n=1 Tax=Aspergillus ibericus CBS 121593 TaxID=1448316 RepID=A0A395GRB0_9EURO|nr:hypothetical protein BO80DRAFT_495782 [Aspergillus ibericus CBS 121593]RAK98100.1 hypothetical protein BO80DRAFT_495782 [Aspergillus ibericus CBS 121593]
MLFSATKILTVALAMVNYVAAAPVELAERDQKVIIGYRTVDEKKAEAYNKHETVVWYTASGIQLGDVVYLTPAPGQWKVPENYWHCVIYADHSKWLAAKKAWIPETYDGKTLWYEPKNIDSYLKNTRHETPDETLRLSVIKGDEAVLQLGIPKHMLGKTSHLGLTASCKPKASDLPQHSVNYKTLNNVVGTPQ